MNRQQDWLFAVLVTIVLAIIISWGLLLAAGFVALYSWIMKGLVPDVWGWCGLIIGFGSFAVGLLNGIVSRD